MAALLNDDDVLDTYLGTGVSITNEDLVAAHVPTARVRVNGPRPALDLELAAKLSNGLHFDQPLLPSVPPFTVIPHLAIRTYPTFEICLTSLRATGASQLHRQHHFRLTNCTTAAANTIPTNADLVAFVADIDNIHGTASKTANVDKFLKTLQALFIALSGVQYDIYCTQQRHSNGI